MTSSNQQGSKTFPQFKLLTFNCLVQDFIDEKKYPKSDPAHLIWTTRFARFQQILRDANADVVCLQEIDESLFQSDWQSFLNAQGYQAHYQKKAHWGNVTAFKSDKFSLEWIDHRSRALLCLLRCVENLHPVYFANVHLSAKWDKCEEKVNQIKSLFKQIEKHQQSLSLTMENSSIVVCGDFNSSPNSGAYNLFVEGKLRADYRDPNSDLVYTKTDLHLPCPLKSSYATVFGSEPTWTYSYQDKWVDSLDYVFYSPMVLDVVHVDKIETTNRSKDIPNALDPSDHLPMIVDLKIRVSAIRRLLTDSA